jgi:hypothetical protein
MKRLKEVEKIEMEVHAPFKIQQRKRKKEARLNIDVGKIARIIMIM